MKVIGSSFRDPSGYVYEEDGVICRKITPGAQVVLSKFLGSTLYGKLLESERVLPFTWVGDRLFPDRVPFISYPYEWSFSMLKDAALLTLDIELLSLSCGMQLKDASAYNVQFVKGKPIFIDHLSFYPYEEGKPWAAYGQFCRHFLAPLALAAYKDVDHVKRLQIDLDGLKLGSASHILPLKANLLPGLMLHLKFHGMDPRVVQSFKPNERHISKTMLTGLVKHLRSVVSKLDWKPTQGWKDYEKECNYDEEATHRKGFVVEEFLRQSGAKVVADLGCNVGLYSQVALDIGCRVIAVDSDPACIELVYTTNSGDNILPLVVDMTNPSPAIGWGNTERDSFLDRLKVDTVMCLALVHHLAIGNNIPLGRIAPLLAGIGKNLVIEWVPKEDSQVSKMLKYREDIFPSYTSKGFERAFGEFFTITDSKPVDSTLRSVYLMERR